MSRMPSRKVSGEAAPLAISVSCCSHSAVSMGEVKGSGRMEIRLMPSWVGTKLLPLRSTKPATTSFSMIAALVAGVPRPFRSASSGISSFPAFSMADRRVSSVKGLGGWVKRSATETSALSKICPSVKSGNVPPSSSTDVSFKETRKMRSISCQPSERIRLPFAVKECPPQSKVAVTASYT